MGQYLNSLKKSASGLGGLIFCGCCMKPAVPEGGGGKPGPYKRPPVIINGKQAKPEGFVVGYKDGSVSKVVNRSKEGFSGQNLNK
jgi:hypothetical protein